MSIKEGFSFSSGGINPDRFKSMVNFERFFWWILLVTALGGIIFGNNWGAHRAMLDILKVGLFGVAIMINIIPELMKNKRQSWLIDRIENGCENIYTEEYYSFHSYLKSGEYLNDEKCYIKNIIKEKITINLVSGAIWIIVVPRIFGNEVFGDVYGYILGGVLILKGILALIYAIVDFNTFILKSKDILSVEDIECDELMTRIKSETDTQMLSWVKGLLILLVLATWFFGKSVLLFGVLIILMTYDSLYNTIRNGKVSKYLGV